MTFLDQQDAFLTGSNEDLSSSVEVDDDFASFAPAAFEQAKSLLSLDALSDLTSLGEARSSVDRPAIIDLYSGIFEDSDDGENLISPEDANAKFGFNDEGEQVLSFNKPISEAEAGFIRSEKLKELTRLRILDRLSGIDFVVSLGVELLADLSDPLGLATIMLPVARANTFTAGFAEGAVSAGIAIAPGTFKNTQIQAQFQAQEAVLTIIAAGALSGSINKVIGKVTEPREIKPPTKTKEQVFDEDIFKQVLVDRVNGGKDENLPEKLFRLKEAQKDVEEIKDVRNARTEISDLKKEVLATPDSPEKSAQLAEMDRAFLDLRNKETALRKKATGETSTSLKDIKSGLEQEPVSKASTVTGKEKVTRVKEQQDPAQKESRQADQLDDLAGALKYSKHKTKGFGDAGVEDVIGSLRRVLGRDNGYDELLQSALDNPNVFNIIFNKLEALMLRPSTSSKAGGFTPNTIGGAEVNQFTEKALKEKFKKVTVKQSDKEFPDDPDFKYVQIKETTPDDYYPDGQQPIVDSPRSDIKQEIRQALGAIRSRVARGLNMTQRDNPGQIAFDFSQEAVAKAAKNVKSSLSETLREPNTVKNIDEDMTDFPEQDDISFNRSASILDMEDINNSLTVQSVENLEDATYGRAGNLEELEEHLLRLREDPAASEKDIANMEQIVKIETGKEEQLTAVEKKMEGVRDALDCATGETDG